MSEFEAVLQTPELGPGQSREVQAHGDHILVINVAQMYYAVEARCPDSGTALEVQAGALDRLVCPDDAAEYDLRSGTRLDSGGRPLRRFAVRVEGNAIKVGPPLGEAV